MEQLLEIWSRRKWLGIVVFAAVLTAAGTVVTVLPDIYRSTATVLVERHQVAEAFVKSSVTGELETRLQTISQEILSRARLEGVINRFGLYPDLRERTPLAGIVEKMRRDIQLEIKGVDAVSGRATVSFNLSYRGRQPETVARVTNTLASFYVEENTKLRAQQASSTAEFLGTQLAGIKKRLDEQEQRVKDFRTRYVGELPQQLTVNLATLERLHAQLHLNSANQLRATDRLAALEKQLAETDPGGGAAATSDPVVARLAKLKEELRGLRGRFSDKYPDVIRMKADIAALEQELAERKPDGPPKTAPVASADPVVRRLKGALSAVDAEIKSLQAEDLRLRSDIAAYQQRVESAPQREQEFKELSRDYETTKDLYSSLLKRYEDAQLAESMEENQKGEQFRILDPALPEILPAAPNRLRLTLMGLMLALGAAAAVVVLAEQLGGSFHSVSSLRAFTKVPVLVSIPLLVTVADRRRMRWRSCLVAVAVMLSLALIAKASASFASGNELLAAMLMRGGS